MGAVISADGRYRLILTRNLGGDTPPPVGYVPRRLVVVMVNPSTADADMDDATIRKLKGFALRAGYGSFTVVNLFSYRATDVRELGKVEDPVGPVNDAYIRKALDVADGLLFAWGPLAKQPARFRDRWRSVYDEAVRRGLTPLCLGVTKDGHPRHPLMVPYSQPMVRWDRPA